MAVIKANFGSYTLWTLLYSPVSQLSLKETIVFVAHLGLWEQNVNRCTVVLF